MGFKDLRSFLSKLEEEGQLVRYSEPIALSPDWSDITRALPRMGQYGPAILADNLEGYKGKKIVAGVHASLANCALMFGHSKHTSLQDQINSLGKRWVAAGDASSAKLVWVENPPCQEVIIEGDDVNLYELLPLHRLNPSDGGFYLPKTCVVTKDMYSPDDIDSENVGTYRCQIHGPNTIGINISNMHDAGEHIAQAEALGVPMPIAICLGNDPMLDFMASTPLKSDESEYKYAAALGDFTYELTKATLSNLDVPANAEFVIEGEILPFERFPEGPFGEFPGTYSGVGKTCRIHVKRVTHRKDPIYSTIYIGGRSETESDMLLALNTCSLLYNQLRVDFPQVRAVNAMYQHGMTTIVSAKPRSPGHAKTIALRVACTPHGTDYCRNIIMVDAEVDPFNLTEVMWALSTRVRCEEDVFFIPSTPGLPLIPADVRPPLGRKLVIDATTPIPPDEFRPSKVVEPYQKSTDWRDTIAKIQQQLQK